MREINDTHSLCRTCTSLIGNVKGSKLSILLKGISFHGFSSTHVFVNFLDKLTHLVTINCSKCKKTYNRQTQG